MAELILRDYQHDLADGIRDAWKTHRAVIAWLPTGGGKTELSVHFALAEHAADGTTLFVVERKVLATQAQVRYAEKYGMEVGVIRGEATRYRGLEPALVASIQTLRSRWENPRIQAVLARVSLIVIDEAHIQHSQHRELLSQLPQARVLGLTATPLREGLGLTYGALVKGPSYATLIDQVHLVRPRYFLPQSKRITSGLQSVAVSSTGDYADGDLSRLMRDKALICDLVSTWQAKGEDRQTIVFCVDIAHSTATCDAFRLAGIAAEHIDKSTPDDERRAMFARFRTGETRVLCSIVVLAVGFDEPVASCAVLARPTLSLIMHVQQIGRVLRTHPDKRDCIVLDHACNVIRHGRVEDFDPPDLSALDKRSDKKRRTDSVTDFRPCPQCSAIMSPGQRVCDVCGHELERKNRVHFIDGELAEAGIERQAVDTRAKMKQLYLELRWIAEQRGYKDGWAFVKLKEQYGFAAPWAWKNMSPVEASSETSRLVKSWQIAYSKRRRAA